MNVRDAAILILKPCAPSGEVSDIDVAIGDLSKSGDSDAMNGEGNP